MGTSAEFAAKTARRPVGDHLSIQLERGGQQITKTAILKPRPYETTPDADVLYESVTVDGVRRRTIITRPKTPGRHPAVLLIGGLGCYSLDGFLTPQIGYGRILLAFAKQGYVTMRVEKTGEGDSEGPACTDLKATAELDAKGHVAGLRALKKYDFVDPDKVFVFAHSVGPVIASLALAQEPVHGFIAAETLGRSWFEYHVQNVRRETTALGEPLDKVEEDVRAQVPCLYHFFVLHESSDEVSKLGQPCKELIQEFVGVPYTFMHQVGDVNLAKLWKQIDIPVLVIYGTADAATSTYESQMLVDVINSFHPGRATYREFEGMGHDFKRYASQTDFLESFTGRKPPAPHPFVDDVVDVIIKWAGDHLS